MIFSNWFYLKPFY